MSLVFLESFEDQTWFRHKWTSLSNIAPGTSLAGRNTGNGLRWSSNAQFMQKIVPAASEHATFIAGFAVRIDNGNNNSDIIQFKSDSGATIHTSWGINGTSSPCTAVVWRGGAGGTVLSTSTQDWQFGVWYWVDISVTLHDSTGAFTVKRDGVTVQSGTNVDTKNGGTKSVFDSFRVLGVTTNAPTIDDLIICNGAGSVNNTFIGDSEVEARRPNGDGNSSQFTGSDGNSTNNYLLVDEAAVDTADYVQSSTVGHVDLYGYQNLVLTSGSVKGALQTTVAGKTEVPARVMRNKARVSSTNYTGDSLSLNYAPNGCLTLWENNPNTSAPWTIAGFNGAEFGHEVES